MIHSIIKISRPINFFITIFAVIIAALITSENNGINVKIIFAAIAMAFACSAGNVYNDIIDIEIDKINKPGRVLPKGDLSILSAKILYGIFIVISLGSAYYNGWTSFIFMIAVNFVLILYSIYLKKIILLGNIVVSLLTASALVYGAMIAGNLYEGLIPALFAFFTNFIREIIKDIEDVSGDSLYSVKTFSQVYGVNKTKTLILRSTIILIFFTLIPFIYRIYEIEFFIIIMVVVNPLLVYMLKILYKPGEQRDFKKASGIIKLTMIIGLIAIFLGV